MTVETTGTLTAAELRARLTDGGEIAVVDIREGDGYATGHISVAVPIPVSELELQIATRVPRRDTRVVLVDADGSAVVDAAARRLRAVGYTDVDVLADGVAGWAAAGHELVTGLNSLSKALGEFVERRQHTPRITVEQLKAKQDAGEDIVVLDTRPLPEYRHIAIPGGRPAPGAELLYRVFDQIPSPTTQIVVNCAGRTRAIIGAQALINAGVTNPVVSLENGTSAWLFAGYEPVQGAEPLVDAPSAEALAQATAAAEGIRRRFGIPVLSHDSLVALQAHAGRTVYVLDVRAPDEFAAAHLPGAVSAPGGQLVQATDLYVGTRNAHLVLVDSADLVRSSITASWLRQLGLDDVSVVAPDARELTASGPAARPDPAADRDVTTVGVAELVALRASGAPLTVIDLQPAGAVYETRRYLAGSSVARRSTLLGSPDLVAQAAARGQVVLVDADGRLARLAAAELTELTGHRVAALDGGVEAWVRAGQPVRTGLDQAALTEADVLPQPPDLATRKAAFAEYVAWGDRIVDQLDRDGLVRFREFAPLS